MMKIQKRFWAILLGGLASGVVAGCGSTTTTTPMAEAAKDSTVTVTVKRPVTSDNPGRLATTEPADRTNTGINARDRHSTAKTPIDQNENQTDITITADIRKKILATQMSVNARNVKIITQDGMVTLRGPVPTEDEKSQVEKIAKEVAGETKVDSQLEVSN